MSLWSKFLAFPGVGTKAEAIAAEADVELESDCIEGGLSISQLEGFDWQQKFMEQD